MSRVLPALRRAPFFIVLLLFVGLCTAMALTPTRQLMAQQDRLAAVTRDLERTEDLNARLAERIERLQDPDYIEQRARSQVGLVYPGETTYVVMPPSKTEQGNRKELALEKRQTAAPPAPSLVDRFLHFVGLDWIG